MKDYLVFRQGSAAWRFPNGNTPGEIRVGADEWQESVCSPRDFFEPNSEPNDLFDVLEDGFSVEIERMSE